MDSGLLCWATAI